MACLPVDAEIDFPGCHGEGQSPATFLSHRVLRVAEPLISADERAAVLGYADAVLRGEYPLMGYGSPRLGTRPDWQCDWVSQRKWPVEDSEKDAHRSP